MRIKIDAKWLIVPAACFAGAGIAAQSGALAAAAMLAAVALACAYVGATTSSVVRRRP